MYTKEQMEAKDAYYQGIIANLHETLRDKIAMAALTGLISHYGAYEASGVAPNVVREQAAVQAYCYADAMMKARDIRRDSGQSD